MIEEWVAAHSSDEVVRLMAENRVPAGPISSTADIMAEEQYQQRGMFEEARAPAGGKSYTIPAILPKLSRTPGATRWAGPELGHSTDDILKAELGLQPEEIARLRECGAI